MLNTHHSWSGSNVHTHKHTVKHCARVALSVRPKSWQARHVSNQAQAAHQQHEPVAHDTQWESLDQARQQLCSISTPEQLMQGLAQVKQMTRGVHDNAAYLADIQPILSQLILQQIDGMKAADLVRAATMLGGLPGCDLGVVLRLCEACYPQLNHVPASSLAALLCTLAQLGLRPSDKLLAGTMHELEDKLAGLPAGRQVGVLVSLVRLGVRPSTKWLYAWEDATRTEHQDLSCQDSARMLLTLSHIGFTPGPAWLAGCLGALQYQLVNAPARSLADIAYGLGTLNLGKHMSMAWRTKFLQVSLQRMPDTHSSDLSRLMMGAASLQLQPDASWVEAAAKHTIAVLPKSSPRHVLDLVLALIQLTPRDSPAIDTSPTGKLLLSVLLGKDYSLNRVVETTKAELSPDQNSNSVKSFHLEDTRHRASSRIQFNTTQFNAAETIALPANNDQASTVNGSASGAVVQSTEDTQSSAEQHPVSQHVWCNQAWRQQIIKHTMPMLPRFTAQGLAQILMALAVIRASPGHAWVGAYVKLLPDKLGALAASELAGLPAALLAVGYPGSKALVKQLQTESVSKLSLMSDMQLIGLASGLQAMANGPAGCTAAETAWSQAFLRETVQRMCRFSFQELASLPYIVVKLRLKAADSWWFTLFERMWSQCSNESNASNKHSVAQGLTRSPVNNATASDHIDASQHMHSLDEHVSIAENEQGLATAVWAELSTHDLTNLIWAVTLCGNRPPSELWAALLREANNRVAVAVAKQNNNALPTGTNSTRKDMHRQPKLSVHKSNRMTRTQALHAAY